MTVQRPSKIWQGAALAELTALGTDDGLEALDFGLVEAGTPGLYQATTVLSGSSTWTLVGGGGGALPTGLTDTGDCVWVDAINGNDGTGMAGRRDLPFQTISAGLAAAGPGSQRSVLVFPGAYTEASGVVVPEDVSLVSLGGWEVTNIETGPGPAPGTITVDLSRGSVIQGFQVEIPDDATSVAVRADLLSGELASIRYVTVYSQTPATDGIGFQNTGTGKIIAEELRWSGNGGCDAFMECVSGIFAVESTHLPNTASALNDNVRVLAGRFQGSNVNCGSANTIDGFDIRGGTVVLFAPNIFQVTNGIHLSTGTTFVTVAGGGFDSISGFSVLIDPTWDEINSVIRLNTTLEPNYFFPPSAVDSDFGVLSFARDSDLQVPSLSLLGTDLHVGFPERGLETQLGTGPSYARGIQVFRATGATGATDGGSFVDITAEAQSRDSSTFGFTTGAAGDVIYWTTLRVDSGGNRLPHYGVRLNQTTGAVLGAGSEIVAEFWTGAEWREMPVMATSEPNEFRYANSILLRSGTEEDLRFGVGFNGSDWMGSDGQAQLKSVNGVNSYWFRLRVLTTALATPPVFEQLRIDPSHTEINQNGRITLHGLAMSSQSLSPGIGAIGESGGVIDGSLTVGSGTGAETWTQVAPNSKLNGAGDAIYTSFSLPRGIATCFPLRFRMSYTLEGAQPVTAAPQIVLSVIPLAAAGNKVADPGGGTPTIPRDLLTTELLNSKSAFAETKTTLVSQVTLPATVDNRVIQEIFDTRWDPTPAAGGGFAGWKFDISNYYAGDIVAIRFEFDADGSPAQDLTLWQLVAEAVIYSPGDEIEDVR